MNTRYIEINIDGFDVEIEVFGVEGKECLDLTQAITTIRGATVVDQSVKSEIKRIKVPAELLIP